ncbi:carboxypeptidase-like regulatory domain-containing protein [Mucilaginibacter robiniae]|uniref:Carboxypeptidase-like regulatory domain-containing protein n=1 Tax=Mucilaginibacter robiniae TaxID=2728022 RepID=A0A7L5E6M1_9SPHI|nr:carboxypeptidase-like regulatory domain-containing protein [Mucilaginibacter robiniae]QJD97989.1 carboxypeptidase-like regulatory domain-containing protein [Mucilaginibacter robiniae]
MRFYWAFLIGIIISFTAKAQTGVITGKVLRMDTKKPVSGASVFLSNATFGTTTADDGTFRLIGVKPGQYELVITSVGLEEFTQSVLVGPEPVTVNAELLPRVLELHDVIITSGGNWKANYEMFVKEFLGVSDDAHKCRILNPHDINLIYHKSKRTLEASSYDFINIENRAIGYKVKFLINEFKVDNYNNTISWQGKVLYEELPGSASQKALWEKRRQEIYYGSSMHFFRSLVSDHFNQDGFVIRTLYRRPNPQRPKEEIIQKKLDQFREVNRDSMNYWVNKENLNRYDDNLSRTPLLPEQVIRKTEQSGIYALTFPGCLYVVYTKKRETVDFKDIYRPLDWDNYETSVITLYKPYALFDLNGVVVSSQSTLYEGTWSKSKIAELLPVDYSPGEMKK